MADPLSRAEFLAREYRAFWSAARIGQIDRAWHHLERAHIVAQPDLVQHWLSHWRMLRFALRQRDWRESGGQVFRLALVPLGSLTGRLPAGNTGRANVSAFRPMPLPNDLAGFHRSPD